MLTLYIRLITAIDGRAQRDETGDVLAFLAIGALVISVVIFAVPGVKDLCSQVLKKIGDGITNL